VTYFCYGCGYELSGLTKCPECGLKQTEMGRIGATLGRHRRSLHIRIAIVVASNALARAVWHPDMPLPWKLQLMTCLSSVIMGFALVTWMTRARLRSEGARYALLNAAGVALVLMVLGGLAASAAALVLPG